MDEQGRKELEALIQAVLDLSKTLVATRAELDALRLLCTSFFAVAASDKNTELSLTVTLQSVIDADHALALSMGLNAEHISERTAWLQRLTPASLQSKLNFP